MNRHHPAVMGAAFTSDHLSARCWRARRPTEAFPEPPRASEVEPTASRRSLSRDRRRARGSRAGTARRRRSTRSTGGRRADDRRARGAPPRRRSRRGAALDFAIAGRGLAAARTPATRASTGWGWTADTRSFVEPTARVLHRGQGRSRRPNVAVRSEARAAACESGNARTAAGTSATRRSRRRPQGLPADHRRRADRAPAERANDSSRPGLRDSSSAVAARAGRDDARAGGASRSGSTARQARLAGDRAARSRAHRDAAGASRVVLSPSRGPSSRPGPTRSSSPSRSRA